MFNLPVGEVTVTAPADGKRDFRFELPLNFLPLPLNRFENQGGCLGLRITNHYAPLAEGTRKYPNFAGMTLDQFAGEPLLVIEEVEITGPGTAGWPAARHAALVAAGGEERDEAIRAAAILRDVATKAWRRPVGAKEMDPFIAAYRARRTAGDSRDGALRDPLVAVLAAPDACYTVERKAEAPQPLNGVELAGRMAMFLWGGGPDAQLIAAATSGRLADRKVLANEVDRMLNDPRARVFASEFTRGWLALDRLQTDPIELKFQGPGKDLPAVRIKRDLAAEPTGLPTSRGRSFGRSSRRPTAGMAFSPWQA